MINSPAAYRRHNRLAGWVPRFYLEDTNASRTSLSILLTVVIAGCRRHGVEPVGELIAHQPWNFLHGYNPSNPIVWEFRVS